MILAKDAAHHILKVGTAEGLRTQLRGWFDTQVTETFTIEGAAKALSAAFGRGDAAKKILERKFAGVSDVVTHEVFVDVALELMESSGQLANDIWHRYITCRPHNQVTLRRSNSPQRGVLPAVYVCCTSLCL